MNGQNEEAETKWNDRPTLELLPSQELNRHPEGVGQNPQQNGGIVAAFRPIHPIFPEQINGNENRGENHKQPQRLPNHGPRQVFDQPKKDM